MCYSASVSALGPQWQRRTKPMLDPAKEPDQAMFGLFVVKDIGNRLRVSLHCHSLLRPGGTVAGSLVVY